MARKAVKKKTQGELAADKVVKFVKRLKHTKGRWKGQPFNLLPWQENEILRPLFGTLTPEGVRQYQTCYVEIPKKNGKSELAAAIALYMLFADGEEGAEVYSAAVDRAQASIVFDLAVKMVEQSSGLRNRCKILESVKRIVYYETGSFYQVLSADVPTKHGINAHAVIFDELHAQPNRKLWSVLTTGSGDARTQPLTFVITTAGTDRQSICYEQHKYAEFVKKNPESDETFLPVLYCTPNEADWKDKEVWKAVNPSLNHIFTIKRLENLYRKALKTPSLQKDFRQLRLNQWIGAGSSFIPFNSWVQCNGGVNAGHLIGRPCYAGLDLSSTTDVTALVLVFPPLNDEGENVFKVLPFFWVPEETVINRSESEGIPYDVWVREGLIEATPGNTINYKAILRRIREITDTFRLKEMAYDRWGATKLVQDLVDEYDFVLDEEENESAPLLVQFGQGYKSMNWPTKELQKTVLSQGLHHGGNEVLAWMNDNLIIVSDPAGNVKPDKKKSKEKIDGMVALIMGFDRALRHRGEMELTTESVYASRGFESFDIDDEEDLY